MTLPLLRPALSVALIFRTLQALLVFDVIYIMTGGGPGNSTESLSYLSYNTFIINTDFGIGGAMSHHAGPACPGRVVHLRQGVPPGDLLRGVNA